MTSDPLRPGLHPLSHLKAGPTTSSSKSTAVPSSPTLQTFAQTPTRPQPVKHASREDPVNATSDKATIALIRRVLCPQAGNHGGATTPQPPEDLLPPLTSSNEVDRQLYALIAIIVKEFVYTWYSKITSDQVLVSELLQVIAHCTRALEQRLRETDVAQLFLDEIPALVEKHITYAQAVAQQRENESIYRQLLVHGMLAVLLPTEDLENASLRTLLGDILADLVLGNAVAGKISEGWFLWDSITKVVDRVGRNEQEEDAVTATMRQRSRLHKYGLLSQEAFTDGHSSSQVQVPVPDWIWQALQYAYLIYVTLRFIVIGLFRVASAPPVTASLTPCPPTSDADGPPSYATPKKRPVLDYRLYGMVSQVMDVPQRMPWLCGMLALIQYLILAGPGRLGDTDSVLDRSVVEKQAIGVKTAGQQEYAGGMRIARMLQRSLDRLVDGSPRPPSSSRLSFVQPLSNNDRGIDRTKIQRVGTATKKAIFALPASRPPPSKLNRAKTAYPCPWKWVRLCSQSATLSSSSPLVASPFAPMAGPSSCTAPLAKQIPLLVLLDLLTLSEFLHETIRDHVLTPALFPNLLLATRAALFPLNARPASAAADGRAAASAPQLSVQPPASPIVKGSVNDAAGASDACSSVSSSGVSATAPLSPDPRPSTPDVASIKRRCAASILSRLPRPIARRFFGVPSVPIEHNPPSRRPGRLNSSDEPESPWLDSSQASSTVSPADCGHEESLLLAAVEEVLDLFADDYCNKHLIYSIIEAILTKLLPELSERSIAELMEDRGVPLASNLTPPTHAGS
ncbi:PXA domain-containing protein [Aspergillus vadensis CBS 113365]|uniref:PXA domain-containing protein n=1 Tax=Aspergillus vadensis (strain CBS 113365 / IMI 142717 / IBT 24658) TaxID=1448311 RepID=A0A319BFN3_ASPVC|nr:hypothetical protein BO88DRAFT_442152 [Aspergillus vadensis CBS 113365]PYH71555.1 hypothetical protein BO88DRAFT_442152 [Aspergillus vadensis CBS 113365]